MVKKIGGEGLNTKNADGRVEAERHKKRLKDHLDAFEKQHGYRGYDVPYQISSGEVTVIGLLHVREPLENSSTDGYYYGAANGSYNLSKDSGAFDMYGLLTKVVLYFGFSERVVRGRIDTWKGDGWNEGSWVDLASW